MPYRLLRFALHKKYPEPRMFRQPERLKKSYDVVIIGGGGHEVVGALFHPPGAVIRHDAVAWGYARACDRRGIEIHQKTEVTGIDVVGDQVVGVRTNHGTIETKKVLSAVAGYTPRITRM